MSKIESLLSKQPTEGEYMTDEDGDRIVAKGEFDQEASCKFALCQTSCICCISFPPLLLLVPCMIPAIQRQVRERELVLT